MDKSVLKIIADNPALIEALQDEFKKVYNREEFDIRVDNETLGQNVRAFQMSKAAVKIVFKELEKYKTIQRPAEVKNPAR